MDCNWITGSCTCHQTILDDSGGRWRPRAPPTRLLLLLLALFAGRPGSRPVALARSPTYGMGRLTGARKLVEDGRAGRNGDGTAARGLISNIGPWGWISGSAACGPDVQPHPTILLTGPHLGCTGTECTQGISLSAHLSLMANVDSDFFLTC